MQGKLITGNIATANIPLLCVVIYKPTSSKNHISTLFITFFLHNRIPYEHNSKYRLWAADNFMSLDILFLCIAV